MATLIKMPVLGQSVEEVRILQWYKQEGDTVAKGEALAEIETDKVNIDWESPEAGVVRRILTPVDTFVKVEAPVLIVGDATESIDSLLGGSDAAPVAQAKAVEVAASAPVAAASHPAADTTAEVFVSPRARRVAAEFGVTLAELAGTGTGPGGRVQEKDVVALYEARQAASALTQEIAARAPKASPLARAVASGEGVNLDNLAGTGAGGRITAGDVRGAATPAPVAATPTGGGSRTVTLTGLRKRVADNIARSVRQSPHVTLNLRADMTDAMRLRKELLPAVEKATGVRLSPTDIIVKAVSVALAEFPAMNAHIDGDTLTLWDDVHIGLAVSLGDDGLIVPIIRDVRRKGLGEIAAARQDIATRARAGQLASADITGGTFTITNLGNYGIESFNPIIAPPQVAILGVGAIADAVVAVDGAPAVRPMIGLSLSFDHRAMDGAPAAAFLARVREILESPSLLLV